MITASVKSFAGAASVPLVDPVRRRAPQTSLPQILEVIHQLHQHFLHKPSQQMQTLWHKSMAWKWSALQELQELPVGPTWFRQRRPSDRTRWLHVTALDYLSYILFGRYPRHSHTATNLAQQLAPIISWNFPAVPCLTSICRIFASRCNASPCKL